MNPRSSILSSLKTLLVTVCALVAVALVTATVQAQNLVQKWANTSITLGSGNNGLGYSPVSGNVIAPVLPPVTQPFTN